jgi:3-methyl-2-oxobutanoate hydroxymethyltransferase
MPTSIDRVSVPSILAVKTLRPQKKLVAITAYDYSMAKLLDMAGVDIVLVGDSLGSVVQGLETTIPVTLDEVIYHSRCVTRGVRRALVVGDLPFMSYQVSVERALESSGRLLKEGGVAAVKLEGGVAVAETIRRGSNAAILPSDGRAQGTGEKFGVFSARRFTRASS